MLTAARSTPATTFQIALPASSRTMEVLFISIYPATNLQQSGRLADISLFCLYGCRLHSCSERPGLAGAWSRRKVLDRLHSVPGIFAPKTKTHRQIASGGGFLELLVMILEYLAPGARRRTHTAGTTEAILVVNWEARSRIEPPIWTLQTTVRGFLRTGDADPFKVLKRWEGPCVASTYFVAVCHCGKYEEFGAALKTTALEARGGIEPPIKVL